jgi:hypothetical protein
MKWIKKGLIFCPKGQYGFDTRTFMVPTPVLVDGVIRVFGSVRDEAGAARLMKIDLDPNNPSKIIENSYQLVLNLGEDGCFDDNGLVMGSIVHDGTKWRLYYVGFQLVQKAKFYAFTGLAESKDLLHFTRSQQTPVIDRKDWMKFIGAAHTVIKDGDIYKVWYVAGNGWQVIDGQKYPQYSVYYTESQDGIHFDFAVNHHVVQTNELEYRIGRPVVYKLKDRYIMFCSSDSIHKQYSICYYESKDGIQWNRMDDALQGLAPSSDQSEWDGLATCYPTLLTYKDKTYMFYNGNGMGETGFGYAELEDNSLGCTLEGVTISASDSGKKAAIYDSL